MIEQDNNLQEVEHRFHYSISIELRRVPLDWEHPKKSKYSSVFKPLFEHESLSEESIEEFMEEDPGFTREEASGRFMPDFSNVSEEQMGICAYETISDGTPISPVFPNTSAGRFALAKYCADKKPVFVDEGADIGTWKAILFGERLVMFNSNEDRIEVIGSQRDDTDS